MDIKVLGIDLGKTVCSLAGLDITGAVVFRKRLQRHRLLDFLDRLPDRRNRSVQAKDVNCAPWTVFMISGGPNLAMASFSASTQKSASSVFDIRQARTLRAVPVELSELRGRFQMHRLKKEIS